MNQLASNQTSHSKTKSGAHALIDIRNQSPMYYINNLLVFFIIVLWILL